MNQPLSVRVVETLGILLLFADFLIFGVDWGWVLTGDLLAKVLILWLILRVTRRGSETARVVLTVLNCAGLVLSGWIYLGVPFSEIPVSEWVFLAATLVWLYALWTPQTSTWLESKYASPNSA